MKQNILPLVLSVALSLLPFSVSAASKPKAADETPSRIEVLFEKPENFTDAKDSQMGTEKGRDAILSDLRSFIQDRAVGIIPAGAKLKMTFTEVDLAGDYEPWRSASTMDVRIVKDIYPPRFDFSYQLIDANGTVLKEGKEQLRDLSFMMRLVIDRSDPLRFEKDMLVDWMRSNLRQPKK